MASILLGVLLVTSIPSQALTFQSTNAGQGTVFIEGTSTLHDWEVKGEDIRGSLSITQGSAEFKSVESLIKAGIKAEVQVPVRSLTSDNRGMDRRMFNALNDSDHANVTFILSELLPLSDEMEATSLAESSVEGTVLVQASGKLTISGNTQDIQFPASIHWDGSALTIGVEVTLAMSDYGVEPPRALMGTIRTGDEVTIRAKWTPSIVE